MEFNEHVHALQRMNHFHLVLYGCQPAAKFCIFRSTTALKVCLDRMRSKFLPYFIHTNLTTGLFMQLFAPNGQCINCADLAVAR